MPWLLPAVVLVGGVLLFRSGRKRKGGAARFVLSFAGALLVLLALVLVPVNFFAAGKLGDMRLGPFPKGMPVNLIASMNPEANPIDSVAAIWKMNKALRQIAKGNLSDEEATRLFEAEAAPALLKVSKSPDWVEDRGHNFAVPLSDEDKLALKEFLKTL
jgi:hypothetical protein